MPDLESLVILLVVAAGAALFVARPLLVRQTPRALPADDDQAARAVRHRIAIETLRDVEADRRAGLLDDASYAALLAEAEARAAQTLAALAEPRDATRPAKPSVLRKAMRGPIPRRVAVPLGAGLLILLIGGSLIPGPLSLANGVVVDQRLAAAQAAERARQAGITQLRRQLATRPNDPPTLVRLANLYLESGSDGDRRTAAQLLLFAIGLDAHYLDAYRLLITAYISAGDYTNAAKATDAFARVAVDSPEVAFFRGLIALQGSGDRPAAIRWFDAFLKAAPNDPRALMVRSLRAEAAGSLPRTR
jgi:cytochrome c-type biogenesis protein CcmI